ncbi:hypothetical protein [Caenimonas sp. SL110]|uniref:hypothetical protein n=1 Tax=Caenimonas sp. SL110 TaxID=1450524 RepID=UPI0006531719|nr:hypothetical protein [Caenimonas sp. SL110]
MHSAPSVTYPVGRSRFAGFAMIALWLLGAAAVGAWWLQAQTPGWRTVVACLLVAGSGCLAAITWRSSPVGSMAWDGEKWNLSAHQTPSGGAVAVALDLQQWILLQWRAEAGSQWLWVERRARPERWDDMRRAVYSRPRPQAPGAAAS